MILTLLKIYFGTEGLLFLLESMTRMALHNAEVKLTMKKNKGENKGEKIKVKHVIMHYALLLSIKNNMVKLWNIGDQL